MTTTSCSPPTWLSLHRRPWCSLPAIGARYSIALVPHDRKGRRQSFDRVSGPVRWGVRCHSVWTLLWHSSTGTDADGHRLPVRQRAAPWISYGIHCRSDGWRGVDGISLLLVVLTGLLFPLAMASLVDPGHGPQAVLRPGCCAPDRHASVSSSRSISSCSSCSSRSCWFRCTSSSASGDTATRQVRGHEVLPVHDARLGADAGRHAGAGVPAQATSRTVAAVTFDFRASRSRPASSTRDRRRGPPPVLALPVVRAGVRGQGAGRSRSTPGCPTPTPRLRRPARSSSPASCSSSAPTASCASASTSSPKRCTLGRPR